MKKIKLIPFIILLSSILALTGFQTKPRKKTIRVVWTVTTYNETQYQVIAVTIDTKEKFYIGAYYMTLSVTDSSLAVDPFDVEEGFGYGKKNVSRLIGYFPGDAFDVFKNKKVTINYGYQHASKVAIDNFDIMSEMEPPSRLFENIPKLTTAILDSLQKR